MAVVEDKAANRQVRRERRGFMAWVVEIVGSAHAIEGPTIDSGWSELLDVGRVGFQDGTRS